MLAWRFDESLAIGEQALAIAGRGQRRGGTRAVGPQPEPSPTSAAEEGVAQLWRASSPPRGRKRRSTRLHAYVSLTDVLMMLGRPREAARIESRLGRPRRYGIDSTLLVANSIEFLATGEWTSRQPQRGRAPRRLRQLPLHAPHAPAPTYLRARPRRLRGRRAHLDAALTTLREDRGQGIYDVFLAELALWELRWTDADQAVRRPGGGELPTSRPAPRLVLRQGAACPGGAGRARARPPGRRRRPLLARPGRELIATARRAAARPRPWHSTPPAGSLAEAEHRRLGDARSEL